MNKNKILDMIQNKKRDIETLLKINNYNLNALNSHDFEVFIDGKKTSINSYNNCENWEELETKLAELKTKKLEIHIKQRKDKNNNVVLEDRIISNSNESLLFLQNAIRVRFIKKSISTALELVLALTVKNMELLNIANKYNFADLKFDNELLDLKIVKLKNSFNYSIPLLADIDIGYDNTKDLILEICENTYNKKDDEGKIIIAIISRTDNEENRIKKYTDIDYFISYFERITKTEDFSDFYFKIYDDYAKCYQGYFFLITVDWCIIELVIVWKMLFN